MATTGMGKLALALAGAAVLSGCEDGQGLKDIKLFDKPLFGANQAGGEVTADATGNSVTTIEKDVEAPEVFQETENGLWDGRPSLGGVWVAHPDVVDPERVIIRNQANGNFIIGALFRRERENPGPLFQVSSDAANELGMLAGAPAELNVTVLRREEVAVAPPIATPTVDTLANSEAIEETTLEPATDTTITTDTGNVDPVAAIAATAIEEAMSGSDGATPVATDTTAATPAPVAVASPASTLSKPFVQIGIFSVESNATETTELLRGAGVISTVKTFTSSGKKYWRVIIGPAASTSERSVLTAKAKELGFGDAYAVTN